MKGKIMPIGVAISGADPLISLEKVTSLGMSTCQMSVPPEEWWSKERIELIRRTAEMVTTTLTDMATNYFRKKGFKTEFDVVMEGTSGISRRFDLVVARSNEQCVVQILNWKRTVGVNVVINLDKASEDVGFRKPIVISEKFSSHAKAYANRKGITLLTRREINKY